MIKIKRVYIIVLTMLIISLSILEPLCIYASESNKGIKPTTEWTPSEWTKLCYYLGSKIGAVGDSIIDAVKGWTEGNFTADGMREKFDDFKSGVSVKNGKIVVSSAALNNFKGLIDLAIEDHGDYSMVETYDVHDFPDDTGAMTSAQYARFMQDVREEYTSFHYWEKGYINNYKKYYYQRCSPDTSYFVFNSDKSLNICNELGDYIRLDCYEVKFSSDGSVSVFINNDYSASYFSVPGSRYNSLHMLITIDGHKVKVWKTQSALRNYLRGTSGNTVIYTSNTYNNYDVNNDNSVSIDASTAQYIFEQGDNLQVELSRVTNSVTNEINNYYVNNGQSMSAQDIQNAIDAALQKYLDSLPSGGGEEKPTEPETPTETETETETETGGDISGNDISGNGVDGPKTVSLLTKIYNKLSQTYNLLKGEILGALNGIKSAVSSGVSGNDVSGNGVSGNDAPSDGKSWFEKIYDKLSEIKRAIIGNTVVGGLGDLLSTAVDKLVDLADTVKDSVVSVVPEVTDAVSDILDGTEETIGKMVDNVGTNFRPVGDKMKTKFPFSIPWDIAAVVGSLSAAPETPVFEIPVVFERYDIDYTLTIDMADFEVISKISRLFLSLTFVLFLTKLTIQVVKMEKEL